MNRQKIILLAATVLLVAAAGGILFRMRAQQRLGLPGVKTQPLAGTGNLEVLLPARVPECESELLPEPEVVTNGLPKDTSYGQRIYRWADGFAVQLNVVLMGIDRTSIHKPEICLTAQGWTIEKSELVSVRMTRPYVYDLPVMKLTAGKRAVVGGREVFVRAVFTYWFVAEDRLTARHSQRMWWMFENLLRKNILQRWAYVSCFAVCEPGGEEAVFEREKQLLVSAVPQFQLAAGQAAELSSK